MEGGAPLPPGWCRAAYRSTLSREGALLGTGNECGPGCPDMFVRESHLFLCCCESLGRLRFDREAFAGASRLYQGHCSGCAVLLMFPSGLPRPPATQADHTSHRG